MVTLLTATLDRAVGQDSRQDTRPRVLKCGRASWMCGCVFYNTTLRDAAPRFRLAAARLRYAAAFCALKSAAATFSCAAAGFRRAAAHLIARPRVFVSVAACPQRRILGLSRFGIVMDGMAGYAQIQQFLESRNIDYLLPAFQVNKIDDDVATSCSDAKLLEIGLVYGDILSFRKKFNQDNKDGNIGNQKAKTYEERAEELRKRIKKTHTNRLDANNRAVMVKPTYQQRDKKKSLHLYLYYPHSYNSIKFKTLLHEMKEATSDLEEESDLDDKNAEVSTDDFKEGSVSFRANMVHTTDTNSSSSSPIYIDIRNEKPKESNISSAVRMQTEAQEFPTVQLTRNCDRPLRYRHSIGSPSLSFGSTMVDIDITATNDAATLYGDEEVDRFFEANDVDLSPKPVTVSKYVADEVVISLLQDVTARFQMARRTDNLKHVIVQRDENRFWSILFKQKFDFRNEDIIIRFAGESGADAGGLLREFLTLVMRNFPHIPGITIGSNDIWLKMALLGVSHDEVLPNFDDGELNAMMSQIASGNTDPLLENDIMVTNDVNACTRLLVISHIILRNYGAIEQFAKGLQSIDEALTASENFEAMKQFLMEGKTVLTLDEFLKILEFKKDCDDNSNTGRAIADAVGDVELFIASLANNEVEGAKLSDLLYLLTGFDRVPPFGLRKKIEV
eukprot:gene2665-3082_t